MSGTPAAQDAAGVVLRDATPAQAASLRHAVEAMVAIASSAVPDRTFASVVDRMDGRSRLSWTTSLGRLYCRHDVMTAAGHTSLEGLHLMLDRPSGRTRLVEPVRTDRTNLVGWSSDPSSALASSLSELSRALSPCTTDGEDWTPPPMSLGHLASAVFLADLAESLRAHGDATLHLSGRDVPLHASLVLPSPYARTAYKGIETYVEDPTALQAAARRASGLLPSCLLLIRSKSSKASDEEWTVCPYRTGLRWIVKEDVDPMERLRTLSSLERKDKSR